MATITVPGILDSASVESYTPDIGAGSIMIQRIVDSSSPQLQMACVNGIEVGDVTLDAGHKFVLIRAVVSSYETADEGAATPLETVTFAGTMAPLGP